MTGFAERLIARSTGRPTGIPLLKPRPAARFEQETSPPLETETSVEPARDISPPVPAVPRTAKPSALSAEVTRELSVPGRPASPEVESDGPVPPPVQPRTDAAAAPHAEALSLRLSDPQEVKAAPALDPSASHETSDPQNEFRPRPLFFDEPLAQPVARPAPQSEQAPAAPAISIGRIDVQFLPQERPVAPQRPQPQRTRGFDAYARARRGEPR